MKKKNLSYTLRGGTIGFVCSLLLAALSTYISRIYCNSPEITTYVSTVPIYPSCHNYSISQLIFSQINYLILTIIILTLIGIFIGRLLKNK